MYKSFGLIQTAILSAAFAAGALWIYRSRLINWGHEAATSNATPVDDHASESDLSESVTLPRDASSPTLLAAPQMDLRNQEFTLKLRPVSSLDHFEHDIASLRSTLCEYSRSLFAPHRATGVVSLGKDMQWSTSNLELLTNWLRFIWPKIQLQCDLTVVLPTIGGVVSPNPTPNALPILPLQLETLSWTGHRDQIEMFFGHLPFHFWGNLAELTLHCNGLTLDDCQSILFQGQHTLQRVKIGTIARVNRSQVLLPFVSHPSVIKPIVMHSLESLDIESLANVDVLFSNFVYPQINALSLRVKHREFDVVKGCLQLLSRNAITPIGRWRLDLSGIMDPLQVGWIYDNHDAPGVKTECLRQNDFAFWDL